MKSILILLSLIATLPALALSGPPLPPGFKGNSKAFYAPSDSRWAPRKAFAPRLTIRVLLIDPSKAVVTKRGAGTLTFIPSATDSGPRPMRLVLTPELGGTATSVCVETVHNTTETILAEYTTDFIIWRLFALPIPPAQGGPENIGICNTVPTSQLPMTLDIRITTMP